MTQARLVITLPEGIWIGDVSRDHPAATFEVLSAVPDAEAAFALISVTSPDVDRLLAATESHDHVTDLSVLQQTEGATPKMLNHGYISGRRWLSRHGSTHRLFG